MEDVSGLMTAEEDRALQDLCNALLEDINKRIPRVIRRLRLKKVLRHYEICVGGVTFGVVVDEETKKLLMERKKKLKEAEPQLDYYT